MSKTLTEAETRKRLHDSCPVVASLFKGRVDRVNDPFELWQSTSSRSLIGPLLGSLAFPFIAKPTGHKSELPQFAIRDERNEISVALMSKLKKSMATCNNYPLRELVGRDICRETFSFA